MFRWWKSLGTGQLQLLWVSSGPLFCPDSGGQRKPDKNSARRWAS